MIEEIWKDIPNYEGRYQASNFGRIKSIQFHGKPREKIMKACLDRDGYYKLVLTVNCSEKTFFVHRLVGLCFVPNPNNEATINHKDGIKINNIPDNLEWVSARDNVLHQYRTGLISNKGETNGRAKLNETYVRFIRKKKGVVLQKDLAKLFDVGISLIGEIQNYRCWRHVA